MTDVDPGFRFTGQKFPEGALVEKGDCAGLCKRRAVDVVHAATGPTYRTAIDQNLCAECMGDFVAGAPYVGGDIYVECDDGLYREVRS